MERFGYNWRIEMEVSYRMAEMQREAENIQILLDAGLYNPGIFERMVSAIENRLVKFGLHIHKNHPKRQRVYQVTTGKYAA